MSHLIMIWVVCEFSHFRLWYLKTFISLLVLLLVNVRLAGDHLFGKLLFTWLSLVVSMMMSFCAVLFPTRCVE